MGQHRLTRERAILGAILMVAIGVRAFGLGTESLWFDETVSATFATDWSYVDVLLEVPTQDPHPPLYYLLLKLWTSLAGASEAGFRSLSLLADLGSIALVYGVAGRLYDRRVGLLAALLVAISPFYVWYAREARMYALLTFFALASFYSLIAIIEKEEAWWRNGWTYVAATVAMCYTHALAPLLLLAQNVYLADELFSDGYAGGLLPNRWLKLQTVVGIAIFPYYLELFAQAFGGGLISFVEWIPEPSLGRVWGVFGTYVGRSIPTAGTVADVWGSGTSVLGELVALLALVAVLYAVLASLGGDGETEAEFVRPGFLLVAWILVPFVGIYVLSEVVTPVLVARYTAPVGVAVLILLARGLTLPFESDDSRVSLPLDSDRGTLLAAGLVVLVLAVPLAGIHGDTHKQQWREATGFVESNAGGDDVVLVSPYWADTSYEFYSSRSDLAMTGVEREPDSGALTNATQGASTAWLIVLGGDGESESVREAMNQVGFSVEQREPFEDVTVYRLTRG